MSKGAPHRPPRAARYPVPPAAWALLLSACTLVPSGAPAGPAEPLPPPGYGTLRQDDVTLTLTSGALQVKVTPLDEAILVATAPDTYGRLRRLVDAHSARAVVESGIERPSLFLVSFFSEGQGTSFVPEEVQLRSLGMRLRPVAILSVTPGFGQRRLEQREPEMAVYVFPDAVDLESDLLVTYGLVENDGWSTVLSRVRAERARARARANVG